MDSIKAQDIIRHIFKDEDKGVEYVTGRHRKRIMSMMKDILMK